jgi:hypothetical protein
MHIVGTASRVVLAYRIFDPIVFVISCSLAILALGPSASRSLGSFHAVLIRLLNRGVTRMRVVGRFRAGVGLCGCHSTWGLLRGGDRASIRIDGNGSLTIAANGLAKPVSDAIGKDICSKHHKGHSQ